MWVIYNSYQVIAVYFCRDCPPQLLQRNGYETDRTECEPFDSCGLHRGRWNSRSTDSHHHCGTRSHSSGCARPNRAANANFGTHSDCQSDQSARANQDSNCNYSPGRNGHADPRSASNRDS